MRRALLLMFAPLLVMPAAHAAAPRADVPISGEAWYSVSPTCSTPLGCNPLPIPLSPAVAYPAGTLHVAAQLGVETARSYLPLPLGVVPAGEALASAVLTVPVDTSSVSGSLRPDASHVEVCVTTDTISPVSGSTDPPPAADCSHTVLAVYSATPAPQLKADLAPMLEQLAQPNASLVLLPAPGESVLDDWHVAFSAHDRTPLSPAPARLDVQVTGTPAAAAPAAPTRPSPTPVANPAARPTSAPAVAPVLPVTTPTGPGVVNAVPAPAPVLASAPAAPAEPTVPQAVASVQTVGFVYPWLLVAPLALGAGLLTLGRHLTRDMRPSAGPRRQPWRTTGAPS